MQYTDIGQLVEFIVLNIDKLAAIAILVGTVAKLIKWLIIIAIAKLFVRSEVNHAIQEVHNAKKKTK